MGDASMISASSVETSTTTTTTRQSSLIQNGCCNLMQTDFKSSKLENLSGSIVALVTPMKDDNDKTIDYEALRSLIKWQISSGTKGIVVMGTTGENPTVDDDEYEKIVHLAVSYVKELSCDDAVPVIAGTGTNNTKTTIAKTRMAQSLGADAALIVTPYYNKPTQEGLIQHYTAVAKACPNFPIILYNVSSRTGCDMLPLTIAKLSKVPSIVGVKEASGNLERYAEIRNLCDDDFLIFSGDDSQAIQAILCGSGIAGVISVAANVVPDLVQMVSELAIQNREEVAELLNQRLLPLYEALFIETNPCPVKYLLSANGRIPSGIRLPLLPLSEKHRPYIHELYLTTISEVARICTKLGLA